MTINIHAVEAVVMGQPIRIDLVTPQDIFRVPDDPNRQFIRFLHDFETEEWDYKPRSIVKHTKDALPETVPLSGCAPDEFIDLDQAWQYFLYGLLRKEARGYYTESELLNAWASLTVNHRAFTDRHAAIDPIPGTTDWVPIEGGRADYVLGVNLDSNKPLAWKCLTTGGNIAEVLEEDPRYFYIKTLDLSRPPPSIDSVFDKPELIHRATEETITPAPGGGYYVGRFPQLKPFGTPIPLIGMNGINRVEKDRATLIPNGSVFSPYFPLL